MNLLTFNKICHLICLQLCYNYSIKYNFAVLICYNPPVFTVYIHTLPFIKGHSTDRDYNCNHFT